MSHETANSSSSHSIPRPALPPFLRLTTSQATNDSSNRRGGTKLTKKCFSRASHHTGFQRWFGTVNYLEKMDEPTAMDENAVCNTRASNSMKRRTTGRSTSRLSTSSAVSRSTASHISTSRTPRALVTSFPPLNVSDIPPRSPTNKSPFSAILLVGDDEDREEDGPAFALWHTEQLRRARLAKLTRYLGEEIPAELVLSTAFLSHGTSRSSVYSYRDDRHECRILDPSSFVQESYAKGNSWRSKSLREQGGSHCTFSVSGTVPDMPSTEHISGGVRSAETTMNMAPITNSAPPSITTPKTSHSNPPTDIPNSGVLHEGLSPDTYLDGHPAYPSCPSAETSSEVPQFSLRALGPSKSEKLRRRPATADGNRRIEKLANFFGVDHDNVSAVSRATQKLRSLPNSAAGDLVIGIHTPASHPEVEVKVSKPSRFWNSRRATKTVHIDDVVDELRIMKAS